MTIKKVLINLLIFFIGVFIGFLFFSYFSKDDLKIKNSYNQGWDDAVKRLEERGVSSATGNGNYYKDILNGEIINFTGDILSVKIIPFDIISKPDLDIREIKISNNTKIIKTKKKTDEQYKKEIEEYYVKHPELKASPLFLDDYPNMFFDVVVEKKDLKVGQKITVKADEEIYNKKSFIAKDISILN